MLSPTELEQVKQRALEISADLDAKLGPYRAELRPARPAWHAVTTNPGEEAKAIKFLADRGFGVYLPQFERTMVVRGDKVVKRRAMFPRHIFLFVWDVLQHWRRICSCPGVTGILTRDEHPIVVPDTDIHRMQFLELGDEALAPPKKRRRRRKHEVEADDSWVVTISCKSYWANLPALDESGRVGVLHRALGLV